MNIHEGWRPPEWDRPSEGVVPTVVPINEIIHRDESWAITVESIRAYPNGLLLDLAYLANPRQAFAWLDMIRSPHQIPRVTLTFSDGRATTFPPTRHGTPPPVDGNGIPQVPTLRLHRGGGGRRVRSFQYWLYTLPPDGPIELKLEDEFIDVDGSTHVDAQLVLDGTSIRKAATAAVVVWD